MTRVSFVASVFILLLVCTGAAVASEKQPTLSELERRVMCPTCGTTIDRSNSPASNRMRAYLKDHIAMGWNREQILDGIVDEYGGDTSIVVASPGSGRGAMIWAVPLVVFGFALIIGVGAVISWRRRGRKPTLDHSDY